MAKPKSVILGHPESSTRIFGYVDVNASIVGCQTTTYPLEVPVDHAAGVEVIEAISNAGQLGGG